MTSLPTWSRQSAFRCSQFVRYLALLFIVAIGCMAMRVAHAEAEVASITSFKFLMIQTGSGDLPPGFADVNTQPAPLHATIEVTYQYDGSQGQAYLAAKAISRNGTEGSYYERPIIAAQGKVQQLDITKPATPSALTTHKVEIFIYTKDGVRNHENILARKTFDWVVDWPERKTYTQGVAQSKEDYHKRLLADAIYIIDTERRYSDLDVAKKSLDAIILDDPSNAQAYLELARIAMKSDPDANERTGYDGLTEAERLIKVALKFNPSYANSYILLGYVNAVQRRTDEAIAAFKKAQQIGTLNLWLYYNWGLALENAKRSEEAIQKYQEGVALIDAAFHPAEVTPMTHSNNRAIPMIFSNLAALLDKKGDLSALDALYKKSVAVLDTPCQKTDYARFRLYKMGDYDAAIEWSKRAQQQDCHADARPVLAAAYLTKWALDTSAMTALERDGFLDRGQAFITNTQQTILDIASSPATSKALPKLKSAGFSMDSVDGKGMTPLAYAAASGNTNAVEALIHVGANPDIVLKQGWTPLMIAAAANNVDVVNVLLKARVDLKRKNADGQDAIAIARAVGNEQIAKMLSAKSGL